MNIPRFLPLHFREEIENRGNVEAAKEFYETLLKIENPLMTDELFKVIY